MKQENKGAPSLFIADLILSYGELDFAEAVLLMTHQHHSFWLHFKKTSSTLLSESLIVSPVCLSASDDSDSEVSVVYRKDVHHWKTKIIIICTIAAAVEIVIILFIVMYWREIRWTMRKISCQCVSDICLPYIRRKARSCKTRHRINIMRHADHCSLPYLSYVRRKAHSYLTTLSLFQCNMQILYFFLCLF